MNSFTPHTLHRHIQKQLGALANEKDREASQRFFKEQALLYGVKTKPVDELVKNIQPIFAPWPVDAQLDLCEMLWQSGYMEEAVVACRISHRNRKQYRADHFQRFQLWLNRYVDNWAKCDGLCNHTLGEWFMKYPGQLQQIESWTADSNRWVRRGAAVSLIVPARKGLFLETILLVAQLLLINPDDLVQKGVGWMLKSASTPHPNAILEFLSAHAHTIPRTTLRYALEKYPPAIRQPFLRG